MNKKETLAFEQLKQELRLAKALSWTQPVTPDVLPPTYGSKVELVTGWYFNAYYSSSGFGGDVVGEGCSGQSFHSTGRTDKTTTQGSHSFYSTKLLALQALRHVAEKQVAKRLADIDARIEKELAANASPNGTDE